MFTFHSASGAGLWVSARGVVATQPSKMSYIPSPRVNSLYRILLQKWNYFLFYIFWLSLHWGLLPFLWKGRAFRSDYFWTHSKHLEKKIRWSQFISYLNLTGLANSCFAHVNKHGDHFQGSDFSSNKTQVLVIMPFVSQLLHWDFQHAMNGSGKKTTAEKKENLVLKY